MNPSFSRTFAALTGNTPFPWQSAMYRRMLNGDIPSSCDIPTGLGKTALIPIWLLARVAGAQVPRRLVYVVNRRTVVDQTTKEVEAIRTNFRKAGIKEPLAISMLRGQMADNRAWSADPSQSAVICGTPDMIGSRIPFRGYRIGYRTRPLHAGFLGQDALIVHDEAHLEPSFQHLLETIEAEQKRCGDPWPLRVMALSATSRSDRKAHRLTAKDHAHPIVRARLHARKKLFLHQHGEKDLIEKIVAQALAYERSRRTVLVFLRTVEDVVAVAAHLHKSGAKVQQLTGTMRGFERDRLVAEDEIFRRFLPPEGDFADDQSETVYLVCTSAGEVGVNISADHCICDLSTLDSMIQRFGRVNRFGRRSDSEIHVFHPAAATLDAKKPWDARRLASLALLRKLRGTASPAALDALDAAARRAAFAPEPQMLTATDILFDVWAMTTLNDDANPGPPVAPYIHGVAEWEPPNTHVAWRDEVGLIRGNLLELYPPRELIDDYPLKPHELLSDRTMRVLNTLTKIAAKHPAPRSVPVWVVRENGHVDATYTLDRIVKNRKHGEKSFAGCTLLLSPQHCRPVKGLLSVDSKKSNGHQGVDVADAWFGERGQLLRARLLGDAERPKGMRLIRTMVLTDEDEDDEDDGGEKSAGERAKRWSWYELPRGADGEGSRSAVDPVLLEVHGSDAEREARRIVKRLPLDRRLKRAIVMAAKLHDIGKERRVWQRSIGNNDLSRLLAKSGGKMRPLDITQYRHELGSMLDAEYDGLLAELGPEERELVLHLIAAHHGRARPHFPDDELFDPEAREIDVRESGMRVMARFARLQKRFGRWGLAYLESLVRAADYAASARPSKVVRVAS